MISIIITAYNNPKYIHECLDSLIKSCGDYDYEILLGIDKCDITLKSVLKKQKKYKNLKIYFFNDRSGTYIIRNSLISHTIYDTILFFDSDDISKNNMISDILLYSKKYDVIKPMFSSFKDGDDITLEKYNTQKNTFGEGVFAIKKNIFLETNGFEPWVCAADSEFNWRLRMNNKTFKYLNRVSFYYRRHSESLTTNSETGMRSKLRMKYHILTKNKKNTKSYQPLKDMVVNEFTIINEENIENFLSLNNKIEDPINVEPYNDNTNVLLSLFKGKPKNMVETKNNKKENILRDNPLLKMLEKKTKNFNTNLKDKERINENRKNISDIRQKTNRQIYEEFHPKKPNRRNNLPNIGL